MHWLQVVAPVLAILLVIGVAVLGVAFVSAVEAFQKIFGRETADGDSGKTETGDGDDAPGLSGDKSDRG